MGDIHRKEYTLTVTPEAGEYYLDLPVAEDTLSLSVDIRSQGQVYIHTYTIAPTQEG